MQSSDTGRIRKTWPVPITPFHNLMLQGKPQSRGNHHAHRNKQYPTASKHPIAKLPPPAKTWDSKEMREGSHTHIP